jgi:hypothetical protein
MMTCLKQRQELRQDPCLNSNGSTMKKMKDKPQSVSFDNDGVQVVSRRQNSPDATSIEGPIYPNFDNEVSTGSHISDVSDNTIPNSDDEVEPEASWIEPNVDPSYADDINSKLQDQGIGVAADQFSM